MQKTPAVVLMAAGVFLWIGCGTEAESTPFPSTGSSSQSTPHPEVHSACILYCNHVYGTAIGCDEDLMETQALGCQSFCGTLAQSIDDECVEPVLAAYDCVVEQAVPYVCTDETSSPEATSTACEMTWDAADECMGG